MAKKPKEEPVVEESQEESNEPKKPNVGPRVVVVGIANAHAGVSTVVEFPSSIAYNNAVRTLTEAEDGETIEAVQGDNRFIAENTAIESMICKVDSPSVYLSIFTKNRCYVVPIAGPNRFRVSYKWLKDLVGKTVDEDAAWLKIAQDDNRHAYIRNVDPVLAVFSSTSFCELQSE